ncbi:Cell wall hydrolase/autolysin precursor [Nitratireductor basaltis]|uniref:N-acetylmuramoyl-L-alanine amidase n=1 Tax=Nitratireductor basaltis TaxID=472175 RepID=A0A084UAP7_9HYPH|nr:Cell wall hydrolase/autolysin precursor [Nitratireductor basaltis]
MLTTRILASIKLILLLIVAVPSLAQEGQGPLLVDELKIAGDANRTRLVVHFDRKPQADWFYLRSPHRFVLDLPQTDFLIDPTEKHTAGMARTLRFGALDEESSRLLLTMTGPFILDDFAIKQNDDETTYRLIVDFVSASPEAFETAMRSRVAPDQQADTAKPSVSEAEGPAKMTLVIDPGHGGVDGGTRGVNGTQEKIITLAFALELRSKLEKTGRYDVVMTRDRDTFLRLDERVRIAREHEADLLISVHADAIRMRNFRGATIYTLSDKASDAEAAATAARENLSDELAGMGMEEKNDEVADILVDLIRRETHSFSLRFARTLMNELTKTVDLVNNPLRSAGFRVLRAPEVPSVLLELGYLSNPEDEELLRDADWRSKAAENVIRAIDLFAEAKGGTGG